MPLDSVVANETAQVYGIQHFVEPVAPVETPVERDDDLEVFVRRIKIVLGIWEAVQEHKLSRERTHDFRSRDEMAELIEFDREELQVAAELTMRAKDGRLMLSDWLATATGRKAIQHERAVRQLEIAGEARRRCPACDMVEVFCICN